MSHILHYIENEVVPLDGTDPSYATLEADAGPKTLRLVSPGEFHFLVVPVGDNDTDADVNSPYVPADEVTLVSLGKGYKLSLYADAAISVYVSHVAIAG